MVDGSSAIWFGAPNFRVLDVVDDGHELTVSVESTVTVAGCAACGTRAKRKDRRWVGLRDAPSGDRAVVVRVWRRIWSCPDPDCATKTWTEACTARRTAPGAHRSCGGVGHGPDRGDRGDGRVDRPRVRRVVADGVVGGRTGRRRNASRTPDRVGETPMAGFDETVMQPAHRRRRRRFITAVVDVVSGQIIDMFEGRDAADLRPGSPVSPRGGAPQSRSSRSIPTRATARR